jgi:hypothetical protein
MELCQRLSYFFSLSRIPFELLNMRLSIFYPIHPGWPLRLFIQVGLLDICTRSQLLKLPDPMVGKSGYCIYFVLVQEKVPLPIFVEFKKYDMVPEREEPLIVPSVVMVYPPPKFALVAVELPDTVPVKLYLIGLPVTNPPPATTDAMAVPFIIEFITPLKGIPFPTPTYVPSQQVTSVTDVALSRVTSIVSEWPAYAKLFDTTEPVGDTSRIMVYSPEEKV